MQTNRLSEALALAEETLQNIELSQISLGNICLRTSRLARLLNDENSRQFFVQAASTLGQQEAQFQTEKLRLSAAGDPDVSVSSSNPNQYVFNPMGNTWERQQLANSIQQIAQSVHAGKSQVYNYVLNAYHQLRFGSVPEAIFERTRERVDQRLAQMVPEALGKDKVPQGPFQGVTAMRKKCGRGYLCVIIVNTP